jgi:hypothetical protein
MKRGDVSGIVHMVFYWGHCMTEEDSEIAIRDVRVTIRGKTVNLKDLEGLLKPFSLL